jgi:hypothetical protein
MNLNVPGGTPNELHVDINNNSGATVTLTDLEVQWTKSPSSQKMWYVYLNGVQIWVGNIVQPPSQISSSDWSGATTIPNATTYTLAMQFFTNLVTTGNKVTIIFNTAPACQLEASN